jgi:glycosyltransferase involved in cell wall biosynthesis
MLTSLGHEVFFYGAEGSDVEEYCNSKNLHFVETHKLADIAKDYGTGDNRFELGYDWTGGDYRHDFDKDRKPSTKKFYNACVSHISKIKKDDDFLLCTQGIWHKPIADALGLFLTVESGIGYRGSVKSWFRGFESSYIQNYSYGYEHNLECASGSYYDRVIPNYFDPDDIEYSDVKGDYYFFIGRMIKRKGILTAALACNALGKKLIIAGQGAHVDERGYLVPNENPDFELAPGTWEYVGFVNVEQRKKYMAHAIATFTPTEYLEIFGGTHVESMLSGTPAITTNFGVFPGTIPDVVNRYVGFRCNTLQDFVDAAKDAVNVNPSIVREYAERFLMDTVKMDYQKWFDDLYRVYKSARDPKEKGWSWLR